MVNRTGKPIDSLHVVVNGNVGVRSMSFDRPARLVLEGVVVDPNANTYMRCPEHALAASRRTSLARCRLRSCRAP